MGVTRGGGQGGALASPLEFELSFICIGFSLINDARARGWNGWPPLENFLVTPMIHTTFLSGVTLDVPKYGHLWNFLCWVYWFIYFSAHSKVYQHASVKHSSYSPKFLTTSHLWIPIQCWINTLIVTAGVIYTGWDNWIPQWEMICIYGYSIEVVGTSLTQFNPH